MPIEALVLVSRHGERERLFKHHTSHDERASDPPLTRNGLATIATMGTHLHSRYLDPSTCGDLCLIGLNLSQVHAESSGFARTIGTAEVLLSHLVPASMRGTPPLPLPVYSSRDGVQDDALLRGYSRCPRLAAGLDEWRRTPTYAAKENSTLAVRRELGRVLLGRFGASVGEATGTSDGVELDQGDGSVALRDVWNAYDLLSTAAPPWTADETAALSTAASLAAWLEAHKFGGTAVAGGARACGGAILGEIVRRLASPSARSAERLVYYSAHYPTMLCLLGALGIAADAPGSPYAAEDAWLGQRPLGLSSILAFELWAAAPAPTAGGVASSAPKLRLRYLDSVEMAAAGAAAGAAAAGAAAGGGSSSSSAAAHASAWRTLRLPCPGGECAILPEELRMLSAQALPAGNRTAAWLAACGRASTDDQGGLASRGDSSSSALGAGGGGGGGCSALPTPVEYASLGLLVAMWLVMALYCVRRSLRWSKDRWGGGQSREGPPPTFHARAASSTSTAAAANRGGGTLGAEFVPTCGVIVTD